MKQVKIVNAYGVTDALSNDTTISLKAKWALYSLRKALAQHYEFQTQENNRLLEKYKGKYDPTTKLIIFETPDIAKEFSDEHNALDNLEIDLKVDKQKLSLNDIPKITVKQIEDLEDFIEFTQE